MRKKGFGVGTSRGQLWDCTNAETVTVALLTTGLRQARRCVGTGQARADLADTYALVPDFPARQAAQLIICQDKPAAGCLRSSNRELRPGHVHLWTVGMGPTQPVQVSFLVLLHNTLEM